MTIEQIIKLSLQYLEVDSEINTSDYFIEDLQNNDTFVEYINNIESAIYMGIARYVSSNIIPLQEIELKEKVTTLEFTKITVKNDENNVARTINCKEKIFNKVKEVYALNDNFDVIHNIPFTLIGSKLIIKEFVDEYKYYCVYYPNVIYFENYRDNTQNKYKIDLANLKVTDSKLGNVYVTIPDIMAINLKYLIYSEIKMEENPNVANINKNYFESYLSEMINRADTQNYQNEIGSFTFGDNYGYDEEDFIVDIYHPNNNGGE